jgi:CheY-like chemotaxis protein
MPKSGRLIIRTCVVDLHDTAILRNRNSAARSGKFICLSVSDSGCGMDEQTKNRIFEPFFTTKEVGKGTGLGLATVYGIVQQHQGWVEVESQIGHGSTFKIFFPACGKLPSSSSPAPSRLSAQGGQETILVVEDEPALRMLVVEILQLYGYHVHQAQSGAAALEVWKEHKEKIDLLLTDMVMPDGISGRELAERLQEEKPALKIVYTSGYSPGMAGKDTALLTGFNFLPKPYPPSKLAEVVRFCLNKPTENPPKL